MLLDALILIAVAYAQIYSFFDIDDEDNYNLDILLGTPPQSVRVALDYASADLLIVPNRCMNDQIKVPCTDNYNNTVFNLTDSETLKLNFSAFSTELLLGGSIEGFWGYDVLELGGNTFNNSVIGIRSDAVNGSYYTSNLTSPFRVRSTLGLGPRSQQNCVMWMKDDVFGPTYDSLIYRVSNATVSETKGSFSVWVDPKSKNTGLVIFGGLDEQYFDPSTYVALFLSFISPAFEYDDPMQLSFASTDISLNYHMPGFSTFSSSTIFFYQPFVYDGLHHANVFLSSSNYFSMSKTALDHIIDMLDGDYSYSLGDYTLVCQTQAYITINVGNKCFLTINLADFLAPLDLTDAAGNALCYLAIDVLSSDGVIVLPNKILKEYYIAVDYESGLISFAQPKEIQDGVLPSSIAPVTFGNPYISTTWYIGPTISLGAPAPTPTFANNMTSSLVLSKPS